jgi:hypothetical protein
MLAAGSAISAAQDAATAPAAPAAASPETPTVPACELHVWPGRGFHTVYYGWAHGGTIDGAQKGRKGYPAIPDEPLSPEIQRGELAKLDIPAILGLTGYRTVIHDQALSGTAIRATPGRQLADSAPCYAELMIDDIVFQNNVINGKWLNVIFRFRQFEGSTPAPVSSYGTYVLSRVLKFPPDPDTDPQPGLDELHRAYSLSVTEFGKQFAAFRKRNGKKKGASITL